MRLAALLAPIAAVVGQGCTCSELDVPRLDTETRPRSGPRLPAVPEVRTRRGTSYRLAVRPDDLDEVRNRRRKAMPSHYGKPAGAQSLRGATGDSFVRRYCPSVQTLRRVTATAWRTAPGRVAPSVESG